MEILKKFGRFIAREFLWLLLTLVLAIPLALLFLWLLGFTTERADMLEREKDYIFKLYFIGYILSIAGIYLIRLIAGAIRVVAGSNSHP